MGKLEWTKDTCPNKANHTPCPPGYIDWHDWAKTMMRTHKQIKCPKCDLFAIWVPKPRRAIASAN